MARDPSKFRDEISAYPAYLGLYRLEYREGQWVLYLSETAKRFLVSEEPDVGAFMRLQLCLFQYPNGMGVAYSGGDARIQANARVRTLELIGQNIHVSPLRLLCASLIADSRLRNVDLIAAYLGIDEFYALVNNNQINQTSVSSVEKLMEALSEIRAGRINPPDSYESRFHILDHTEIISRSRDQLSFRQPENDTDREDLIKKIYTICKIDSQFNGFDTARSGEDLMVVIRKGSWGSYFDGVRTLSAEQVSILASDVAMGVSGGTTFSPARTLAVPPTPTPTPAPLRYALRRHTIHGLPLRTMSRREELADPEVTRIKRERRSLAHKQMVSALDDLLRTKGADPQENPHIDLYAEIPNDGAYLFEVKSGGENLLAQVRKGVSQLYEYKFRYRGNIRDDAVLCLVLPNKPTGIAWLEEYLCNDRGIAICWLDGEGAVTPAPLCRDKLNDFLNAPVAYT